MKKKKIICDINNEKECLSVAVAIIKIKKKQQKIISKVWTSAHRVNIVFVYLYNFD